VKFLDLFGLVCLVDNNMQENVLNYKYKWLEMIEKSTLTALKKS